MSLLVGYELVIKEHVFLGRRNLSFYEDLLKFPNARMAHPSVRGIDLQLNCMVATLAGSVTLKRPCLESLSLSFPRIRLFRFPNVTTVTSFHGLPKLLSKFCTRIVKHRPDSS